ncbi:hypothetical protein Tco_0301086 [Tanacetum coccineum]
MMQRLLNEKHVATEEAIIPPPPPSFLSQQQDLSVDELKQLLLRKLLSHSKDESADADLIMILRKQSEVSRNSATKEDAMDSRKTVNATLEKLSARVAALEQSLKSQAHGLKRRHDDPNEAGDNVMEPRHIIPMQLEFLLLRAELTDVSESSDGERMFDQPSEKKKLKQLTERHDKCVCEKCKKDHLYWQKWDSAPVNSRTGYTSCESVVIPVVQMVAWWDMEDTPELLFGQEVSVQVKVMWFVLVGVFEFCSFARCISRFGGFSAAKPAGCSTKDLVVCPCGGGCIVYAQNCNPKT